MPFHIVLTPTAFADLGEWVRGDSRHLVKLYKILLSMSQAPESGIGSPERLKHNGGQLWSRRVTMQHRVVYEVVDDKVVFYALHGHYWSDL